MLMYNLLKYSGNYSMMSGTLQNYYRDEVNDAANENNAASYRTNGNNSTKSRSFQYKTKITGKAPAIASRLDTKIVVPKYLSKFWISLDLPLIN